MATGPTRIGHGSVYEAPAGEPRDGYSFGVVSDLAGLRSLEPEWNRLHASVAGSLVTQRFDWCWNALETLRHWHGATIWCLTARSGGTLVMVWPFAIHAGKRFRWAQQAGSVYLEYQSLLVAEACDASAIIPDAWHLIKRSIPADVLEIRRVQFGTPLALFLRSQRFVGDAKIEHVTTVDWHEYKDWQDYLASRGRSYFSGLRRKRRRLAEQGTIAFEAVEDRQEFYDLLGILYRDKLLWMRETGKTSPWIGREDYRVFLTKLAERPTSAGRVAMFVLRLNGKPIATEVSLVSRSRCDWFIGSFDDQWGKYSPGQILQEFCLKWAFDRGITYGFGWGEEPYKDHWVNKHDRIVTYTVPVSPRGLLAFAVSSTRRRIDVLTEALRARRQRKRPDPKTPASSGIAKRVRACFRIRPLNFLFAALPGLR